MGPALPTPTEDRPTSLHHRTGRRGSLSPPAKYGKLLHTHGRLHTVVEDASLDQVCDVDGLASSVPVVSRRPLLRTTSCGVDTKSRTPLATRYTQAELHHGRDATRLPHYKFTYQDDAVRARCADKTRQLVHAACASSPTSATKVLLAKHALRFRKALHRVELLDEQLLQDPTFDVLEKCMGVTWAKVEKGTTKSSKQVQ